MKDRDSKARELCEAGLKLLWQGEVEPAIEKYTKGLELAQDEELRELITIRKAEALIAADREGPEIGMLTQIVLRRRTPRHVYISGMALMRRYVEKDDLRRAIFYGEISRKAAEELGEPMARASVLNGLGISLAAKGDFAASLDALEEAYDALLLLPENRPDVRSLRPVIIGNIGGVKVVNGDTSEGIRLLEQALPFLDEQYLISEVMLDLCLGYSDLEDYETAEAFGIRGLDLATVSRQIRNGNHLLARIALAQGREDDASEYLDVVAAYYPEYPAVKELLTRFDLSAVVNWKA